MSDTTEMRRELVAAGRRLQDLGYCIGTYGNLSTRGGAGLLVTPTRLDFDRLRPEDLVEVTLDGRVVNSTRLPSSETEVHRCIYVRRPDVHAVIHSHSLYAMAYACLHRELTVIVEEQAQVLGGNVPCSRYVPAGQHAALGQEVAGRLGDAAAILLANHGVVACGRSLDEALLACQVVERAAQMHLLTGGAARTIPEHFVRSERERYLYKYGSVADHE